MATKEDIIINAFRRAQAGTPDTDTIKSVETDYIIERDDLFSTDNWVFMFDILQGTDLTEVIPDRNLGYKHNYTLPSGIDEVLDVNPSLNYDYTALGPQRALDFGKSIYPENGAYGGEADKAYFSQVGNTLYSMVEVVSIVVKRKIQEELLPSPAVRLLSLRFAEWVARTIKQDSDLADSLRRESKDQYSKTVFDLKRNKSNIRSELVKAWLKKYYRGINGL